MNKRKRREEKWDYASLEWIHRARAKIYEAERRRPLTELTSGLSQRAAAVARRLKLKVIRGAELPMRRRRTGWGVDKPWSAVTSPAQLFKHLAHLNA